MKATLKNGDEWTGEKQDGFWLCRDQQGNLYETAEVPAYRIVWDNYTQRVDSKGKLGLCPINP